jgi:hypothetical protein
VKSSTNATWIAPIPITIQKSANRMIRIQKASSMVASRLARAWSR